MRISKNNEANTPVARLRMALRLTQQELANVLGISYPSVQNYERGRSSPSDEIRKKLVNLAIERELPDIAMELDPRPFAPRAVIDSSGGRLPASSEGRHLADELHAAIDAILASGDAEAIAAIEQFLQDLKSRTITGNPRSTNSPAQSGDILRRSGRYEKWIALLIMILDSSRRKAIQENLTSFAEGIEAERALAELQRRVDAGEFATHLPPLPAAYNQDKGIDEAQRKTTEAQSLEEAAQRTAAELQRTGRHRSADTVRDKRPKTRPAKTPRSGSGN